MSTVFHGLGILLGIGFLIFVHELGHFSVAKWCGVRVDRFSLGFGPTIFGFRRGETEYVISWIPLGGYVKMAGENPGDPVLGSPDEFAAKPVWQRAAIAVAGITMNAIFAVLAFSLAFRMGVESIPPVVGALEPGWPAWKAGLQTGDRILKVGDSPVLTWDEFFEEVALYRAERVPLRIRRTGPDGISTETTVSVARKLAPGLGIHLIGVLPPSGMTVEAIQNPSPAAAAGILKGDKVTGADGKTLASWRDLERLLARKAGQEVDLQVDRQGAPKNLRLKPWTVWTLGVEPSRRVLLGEVTEAAAHALHPGDQILAVDGVDLKTTDSLVRAVNQGEAHPLKITVRRAGKDGKTETVSLEPVEAPGEGRRLLGVTPQGEPDHAVLSDDLPQDDAAAQAGLKGGDILMSLETSDAGKGNIPISCWADLEAALALPRNGRLTLHYMRRREAMTAVLEAPSGASALDLGLRPAVIIGEVRPGSPAAVAGILPGDRLRFVRLSSPPVEPPGLAVSVSDWDSMAELIQVAGRSGGTLRLDWIHDDPSLDAPNLHRDVELPPVPVEPLFTVFLPTSLTLGAAPGAETFVIPVKGVWLPFREGLKRARFEVLKIGRMVSGFFAPKGESLSPKALGGPISIVMGASNFLDRGPGSFLFFLGFVSINLAVLNLMPVPVLDGGLLLMLLIEKVRGAPLGEKTLAIAQYVGLAMVLSLVVFATYNDILRAIPWFRSL